MSRTLTDAQVTAVLAALGIEPVAASPVVAAAPASKAPDWLVARGERKAARREIARTMRASGVPMTPEAWAKAKAAAGITKAEKAAHAAFVKAAK